MSLQNVGWFENAIFYIVMIIGGSMMLSSSIELFAKVFGNGEDVSQSRRLFGGLGHLAGHAAIAISGGLLKAVGGSAKWAANKAYGSYHNTHGGAKASAKHDIATSRYREQLQAKAAEKEERGGSAARASSAATSTAKGGSGAAAPAAAGGAAGRDGRDGKDGARGERGSAGKDAPGAAQPAQTSSTDKGGKQS